MNLGFMLTINLRTHREKIQCMNQQMVKLDLGYIYDKYYSTLQLIASVRILGIRNTESVRTEIFENRGIAFILDTLQYMLESKLKINMLKSL